MASSVHKYLDFLEQKVPIAPANSQEELQAAQTIAGVMKRHDVEVDIEEFDASSAAPFMRGILQIILLVGVLIAGIGILPLTIVFGVLAVASGVILALDFMGNDLLTRYSPPARSQNVIARHKASSPLVSKGNRPIIVVAHYDTPRENFLFSSKLAPFHAYINKVSVISIPVVAICALIQLFAAGSMVGRIFWIVGIVVAIPAAVKGVATVAERFMPCTVGSNDNKSSVATLLSILNEVRPQSDDLDPDYVPTPERSYEQPIEETTVSESVPQEEIEYVEEVVGYRYEEVVGVRHGKEVVAKLGMLPKDCEIEYLDPQPIEEITRKVPVKRVVSVPARSEEVISHKEVASEVSDVSADDAASEDVVSEQDETTTLTDVSDEVTSNEEVEEAVIEQPSAEETVSMKDEELKSASAEDDNNEVVEVVAEEVVEQEPVEEADADGTAPMSGDGDDSGFSTDADATVPSAPIETATPETPDDPEWGTTTFKPKAVSFGRRAALFDLPDPSVAENDPFASETEATPTKKATISSASIPSLGEETVAMPLDQIEQASNAADQTISTSKVEVDTVQEVVPEVKQLTSDPMTEAPAKPRRKAHRLFGRKRKEEQESMSEWLGVEEDFDAKRDGQAIGSWENFERDEENSHRSPRPRRGGKWKGGATSSAQFRVIDGGENIENAPSEEELREAILSMGDDELIAHDIWFVALGASALDHAGIKAFLVEHRTSCRGAFLINLDSVGAGRLSYVAEEGIHNKRRADRRLVRMLTNTAKDLHVDLEKIASLPEGTDATAAMQSSLRSITIMGSDDGINPALSHTPEDVPEQIDERQVAAVRDLVCEIVRRA